MTVPSHQLTWKCTDPCRKTTFLLEGACLHFHVGWWEGTAFRRLVFLVGVSCAFRWWVLCSSWGCVLLFEGTSLWLVLVFLLVFLQSQPQREGCPRRRHTHTNKQTNKGYLLDPSFDGFLLVSLKTNARKRGYSTVISLAGLEIRPGFPFALDKERVANPKPSTRVT